MRLLGHLIALIMPLYQIIDLTMDIKSDNQKRNQSIFPKITHQYQLVQDKKLNKPLQMFSFMLPNYTTQNIIFHKIPNQIEEQENIFQQFRDNQYLLGVTKNWDKNNVGNRILWHTDHFLPLGVICCNGGTL